MRKISEVILEIAGPFYDDISEVEAIIKLACLGWNKAIVQQLGKPDPMEGFLDAHGMMLNFEKPEETFEMLEMFKDIKLNNYETDNRLIHRPIISETSDGLHLDIEHTFVDFPKRQKLGRNDPCPCGSGKKYKKCCL